MQLINRYGVEYDTDKFLRLFLVLFCMGVVYCFPIWLADRYYNDDLLRSIRGYTDWGDAARPFASWLTSIFNFQYPWMAKFHSSVLVDTGPLLQILAVAILAFGATLLGMVILNQPLRFSTVLVVFPIIGSPFLLENLSYKFDALSMAVALTISIAAAINIKDKTLDLSVGVILLTVAYGLYQPSVNVFIGTSALFVLAKLWNDKVLARKFVYMNIAKFVGATLIYELAVVSYFPFGSAYSIMHSQIIVPSNDGVLAFIRNVGDATTQIVEPFSDVPLLSFFAITSIAIFGARITCTGSKKLLNFGVFVIGTLIIVFSICGILLVLQNPMLSPRAFMGLTVFLVYVLFCIKVAFEYFKRVSTILLVIPVYYLYFLAFAYGAAAKSQTKYDYQLSTSIVHNLNSLGFEPESILILDGVQPRSPVLQNSRHIEFLDHLVQLDMSNQWVWGYLLMEHQGLRFRRSSSADIHAEIMEICKQEPVWTEQMYKIYKYNRTFVIGFENGRCFQRSF
jgi:hypothetical protein